jgi:hypothetical protein
MRSMSMPSLSHQTDSLERLNSAVVCAYGRWQAELLEETLEDREGVSFFCRGEGLAGDEISACEVGDCERVAIAPVRQHELALVVGAPQRVGRKGLGKGRAFSPFASVPAAPFDQAVAIEDGVDRADRRKMDIGIEPSQSLANLRRPPGRLLLLQTHDQLLDLERKLIGLAIGPS